MSLPFAAHVQATSVQCPTSFAISHHVVAMSDSTSDQEDKILAPTDVVDAEAQSRNLPTIDIIDPEGQWCRSQLETMSESRLEKMSGNSSPAEPVVREAEIEPGDAENGQSPNGSAPDRQPRLTDYTQRLPFAKLMAVYICLATCFFVSFLDVNSVSTALPAIGRSLGASNSITWVGTTYLLAQCAFQVLYGRLADIFGRKVVLLGCVLSLIAGDILCGFAQNGPWLYTCRAIGGVGGGGISSLVQITVSDLVSLKERGKYQGILSGAIGLDAGVGPFAAGALIQGDQERWRWAFWLPAMLAALCVPPLFVLLPQKPVVGRWRTKVRNVDWIGLVTIVTGILFVLVFTFPESLHVLAYD